MLLLCVIIKTMFYLFIGNNNPNPSGNKNSIAAILDENKRLKHDKERLTEQLSQSKGALRETLDRLHKKDSILTR